MREILAPLRRSPERPVQELRADATAEEGRTGELRRKHAALLEEAERKDLRAGADEALLLKVRAALLPGQAPAELLELYAFADGEFNAGFVLPQMQFMRSRFMLSSREANQRAIAMQLLPRFLGKAIPFATDLVGNHFLIFVLENGSPPDDAVYFLDAEDLMLLKVSSSLQAFFTRVVRMHVRNTGSKVVCPGDFRSLQPIEIEIAAAVEADVYPIVDALGHTRFDLNNPASWRLHWNN